MSTPAETWTVGRLLQWTTEFLRQHGAESPRLDAEVLLAESLACPRIALYTRFHEEPDADTRGRFRELVRRRAAGTPVAYLVGHREFYSLDLEVTPDVLVPRPDTELLVLETLDALKARDPAAPPPRVVDVGTGSGAVAVAVACHAPQARVTALEISPAAAEVARRNVARHKLQERVQVVPSDLFAALAGNEQFDVIVSNPPYVTTAEMEQLPRDVRQSEPPLALHGGEDGLDVIRRLIEEAPRRLVPAGVLLLEISPQLADPVRQLLQQTGRFQPADLLKDLAGQVRVVRTLQLG